MSFVYQVLNATDRSQLRMERVRSLEAELCRIELALEDALSSGERDSLYQDAEVIRTRLAPHYMKLGITTAKDEPPLSAVGPAEGGASEDGRGGEQLGAAVAGDLAGVDRGRDTGLCGADAGSGRPAEEEETGRRHDEQRACSS